MNKSIGFGCLALVLAAVLILGMGGCSSYNGLVSQQQNVEKAWAQVETVYQRRLDLIPNLVATVEGQAGFEKSTLTEIATARASINQIRLAPGQTPDEVTMKQFESAQGSLGSALGRLLAVSENYPQLRANEGFMNLQAELAGTENRISVERGRFNEAAQSYNTAIRSIPAVFYAAALGFQGKAYFKSSAAAAEPPKVQFNIGNKPAAPNTAVTPPAPALPTPSAAQTPPPVPAPVK
jgi:LemA protein